MTAATAKTPKKKAGGKAPPAAPRPAQAQPAQDDDDDPPAVRYEDRAPEEAERLGQLVEQFDMCERTKLATATEGGRVLTEAHAKVGAGGWGEWLAKHFAKGRSTAGNWQRLHLQRDRIRAAIDAGEIRERVGEAVRLVAEPRQPSVRTTEKRKPLGRVQLTPGELGSLTRALKKAKVAVDADTALAVLKAVGWTYGEFLTHLD